MGVVRARQGESRFAVALGSCRATLGLDGRGRPSPHGLSPHGIRGPPAWALPKESLPLNQPDEFYNLAHVISPVPHAVVARGLARRPDLSRVRRSAHRFFTRTSPDPPHGGIDRRPLARFTALHGHRFRN